MSRTTAPANEGPPAHDEATPTELRGLIDFVNSRASAKRAERFDTREHAERFLALCDLDYDGGPLSAADVTRLRTLRDALVAAVDGPADDAPWNAVNEVAATVALHLRIAPGPTVALDAVRANATDDVIAQILDRVAAAISAGRWSRLGACARCRRVFYDSTRSHTRRWCSYATCGNRSNVANHRMRA